MAEKKHNVKNSLRLNEVLQKIYVETNFHKSPAAAEKKFFVSEGLKEIGNYFSNLIADKESLGSDEWQKIELSQQFNQETGSITLVTLPQDIEKFKKNLQLLEQYYLRGSILKSYEILGSMVMHGQELLRRKYMCKLLNPERKIPVSDSIEKIIEAGASAIQQIAKSTRLRQRSFLKFNAKKPIQTR